MKTTNKKTATLTIKLKHKIYVKQTYSYIKQSSVLNKINSIIDNMKSMPHLNNAEYLIEF